MNLVKYQRKRQMILSRVISTLLNIHLGLLQSRCDLKGIPAENPKTIENTGV